MKTLAKYIRAECDKLASHPFFAFLRDESVDAEVRLSYAPFCAHFVLTFADANRFLLPDPASEDPIQKLINTHAAEDAQHWVWYVSDLEKLGWSPSAGYADALRFLWSDAGRRTREFSYYLASLIIGASPLLRLAVLEAMEGAGNVWLTATTPAARHLAHKKLVYFADHHLDRETGHVIGSTDKEIHAIVLPDDVRAEAQRLLPGFFARGLAFGDELLERMRAIPPTTSTAKYLADTLVSGA
jgi:hypothetical protein